MDLNRSGSTLVIVTHDSETKQCSRIVRINDGRIFNRRGIRMLIETIAVIAHYSN